MPHRVDSIRNICDRLRLAFSAAGHTCLSDVELGGCEVNIIAQAPGQPRFAVVVDWIENSGDKFTIHEDLREELESVFLCPVYFVAGVGQDCSVIRVEPFLSTKMLPVCKESPFSIETFSADDYSRPLPYLVLEVTYVRGEEVKIVLDRAGNQFRVRARWGESGLVNGYELRMDQIGRIPLAQARRLPAIAEMTRCIRELAEGESWDQYSREANK